MLDSLIEFRKELSGSLVRKAVAAGAKVIYDEIKVRAEGYEGQYAGPVQSIVPRSPKRAKLSESIIRLWDKKQSVNGKQVYLVMPDKKAAGHWFQVEYGHFRVNEIFVTGDGLLIPFKTRLPAKAWVPPRPYIRPAWDAKKDAALAAILAQMKESLQGITTIGVDV
jgi:hypothetical protein